MKGYRESSDQNYAGWYDAPTPDGPITVSFKKSGVLAAHKVTVPDWDTTTARRLIDEFVGTGKYPEYPQRPVDRHL